MSWVVWAILLLLQNASFTWVSRARNSPSLRYHAIAAVFSNGIFLVNQFVIINKFVEVRNSPVALAATVAFYILFTAAASVGMHSFLMKHVERKGGSMHTEIKKTQKPVIKPRTGK
jgi:hypothetical protein